MNTKTNAQAPKKLTLSLERVRTLRVKTGLRAGVESTSEQSCSGTYDQYMRGGTQPSANPGLR